MGILEVLTVVFIILKLVGTIDWSWWAVLAPTIFSFSVYAVFMLMALIFNFAVARTMRQAHKSFNEQRQTFLKNFHKR